MNDKLKIIVDVEKAYRGMKYYSGERNEYKEYEIAYILGNPKDRTDVIAFIAAKSSDEVFFFNPYNDKNLNTAIGFTFEEYFFEYLDKYEIIKMSFDSHISLWNDLKEHHEAYGELPSNIQKYLSYCEKHHITHNKMKKEFDGDMMNFFDDTQKHGKQIQDKER